MYPSPVEPSHCHTPRADRSLAHPRDRRSRRLPRARGHSSTTAESAPCGRSVAGLTVRRGIRVVIGTLLDADHNACPRPPAAPRQSAPHTAAPALRLSRLHFSARDGAMSSVDMGGHQPAHHFIRGAARGLSTGRLITTAVVPDRTQPFTVTARPIPMAVSLVAPQTPVFRKAVHLRVNSTMR